MDGAYQADILRAYLECEVPPGHARSILSMVRRTTRTVHGGLGRPRFRLRTGPQVDLSGPLGGVQDWYIVDSTTVTVRDARIEECPGTGDDAALKVHTVLSVGCGAPVRDHCSLACEHASQHLPIDESWQGYGLLTDLA